MSNFVDQVLVKLDERYTIGITKDHNQGLVIQVARMNPKHVRGDTGAQFEGHTPVIVWTEVVPFGAKAGNELNFYDPVAIETNMNKAVVRAKAYAQRCIQMENSVDTMLNKLNQEINK